MARLEDGAEPHEVYPTILVLDFGYVKKRKTNKKGPEIYLVTEQITDERRNRSQYTHLLVTALNASPWTSNCETRNCESHDRGEGGGKLLCKAFNLMTQRQKSPGTCVSH